MITKQKIHPGRREKFTKTSGRVIAPLDALEEVKKAKSVEKIMVPAGSKDAKIRVVPLGGLEEVGRNMMYLEYLDPGSKYHGDIIIIDIGLQFPEENMPGIDYIIPDIKSLVPKRNKIKAALITHAHYDHIGGIPHVMPKLGS